MSQHVEVLMRPHYLQVCVWPPGWKTWECAGGAGGVAVHFWRRHPLVGPLPDGADLGFLQLFRPQLWALDRQVLLHGAFSFFWGLFVEVTFQFSQYSLCILIAFHSQSAMSEAMSRRIRAIFNTFNFWSLVLYNILALNSLDFAKLVAKRLLLKGDFVYFLFFKFWNRLYFWQTL